MVQLLVVSGHLLPCNCSVWLLLGGLRVIAVGVGGGLGCEEVEKVGWAGGISLR